MNATNTTTLGQVITMNNGVNITPGGNQTTLGLGITAGSYPAATLLRVGSNVLTVTGSNVGINKAAPNANLDVNGSTIISGSLNVSGSGTVSGDLTVRGNLMAQQFIVSSSVSYITTSFSSGSTKFGDTLDDTHQFTGSVRVTGSLQIPTASSNPTGTVAGQLYYNTTDTNIYRYDGSFWLRAAGTSGTSGTSGSSGSAGTSGTSGSSGSSGTS